MKWPPYRRIGSACLAAFAAGMGTNAALPAGAATSVSGNSASASDNDVFGVFSLCP